MNTTQEVKLSLIDAPDHFREHSPEALESLLNDIQEHGQLQEIVVAAKPDGRFLRLYFPVGAPESLRCRGIPFRRVRVLPGGFKEFCQLKRHHGVPRLLKEIRKLPRRIFAGARSADAGGNLFPVGHFLLHCSSGMPHRPANSARARGRYFSARKTLIN